MEITKEQRNMVIGYYNAVNGCRIQYENEYNVNLANKLIATANGDTKKVRNFIKEHKSEYNSLSELVELFESEVKEVEPEKPKVNESVNASVDFLGQVVTELLAKTKADEIRTAVTEKAMDEIRDFIQKEYGTIERKVDLVIDGEHKQLEGVVHEKFDTILKFVKADEPVFLTGPAGAGKNYLCQQVAKALGLDFYFSNAVTQEYKITGFTDAMGTFHESQFYKAFKYGGLFMLDEMDASIPEVLIILNAAIANRYFDFPAPIGYVAAHPNFRVVAAGNTFGNGADYDYVGRNQLDAASLDRFAMVRVDYDKGIEDSCCMGNVELVNFLRMFRKVCADSGIRTVVSYRAVSRMAKLDASMKTTELLETCLLKSLELDDLKVIANKMSEDISKYRKALSKVISERSAK